MCVCVCMCVCVVCAYVCECVVCVWCVCGMHERVSEGSPAEHSWEFTGKLVKTLGCPGQVLAGGDRLTKGFSSC